MVCFPGDPAVSELSPDPDPAPDALERGRLLVRRLLDENIDLLRELGELRRLRRLARRDGPTRLPGRDHLHHRLAEELGRARWDRRRRGALLLVRLLDVGQAGAGAAALAVVAEALQDALRLAEICKSAPRELGLLLLDADPAGVQAAAARARAAAMRAGARRELALGIGVGAALWPDPDIEDPSRAGDIAVREVVARARRALGAERRRLDARAARARVVRDGADPAVRLHLVAVKGA
jgi:GGDEF domain-containing protein